MTKRSTLANLALIMGLSILLATTCYFGYQLRSLAKQQEQIREDYATLNSITFGVFSIDLWREKITDIITGEISDYKITADQQKEIRSKIEEELHSLIDQLTKEFNKPQRSIGGKLKKFAFRQFIEPKELHQQVPSFARTITQKITSPKATKKFKNIATDKLDELASQTYDSTKIAINAVSRQLFTKYYVRDAHAFNKQIEARLQHIEKATNLYVYAILGMLVALVLLWIALRKKLYLHTSLFVLSLLFALVTLTIGITISIIEVDARLSSLDFLMMGQKVSFENQVLFYQSKSILGIAQALIAQPKPDSITVGILIILFVIILPILRMAARGIHLLCSPPIAENATTRYLAFEAGKWDMADVMVVGILMTYIGLNGILKSQLSDLNMKDEFLSTTTVNYTSLQPGYIIFVGYVVFAIALSYFLKKIKASRC